MTDGGTYLRVSAWVLGLLMIMGIGFVAWKRNQYEKQAIELRNQIAKHDQTLEVQKGLYEKKLIEMENLKTLLDTSKIEQAKLKSELDKNKSEVLSLTELSIKLKKDYEAQLSARQTTVVSIDGKPTNRVKVEFDKEFGPYKIMGHTLTNPAEAWLKLTQTRPLRLTISVSQQPDKSWRVHTASSEENELSIDIQLAAVSPYVLGRKWYENLGLFTTVAGGTFAGNGAALFGSGITYDLKQFSFGPTVWFSTTGSGDKFFGASFTWRPFMRR